MGPEGLPSPKPKPQTTTTPIIPIIQNHAHHGSSSPPKRPPTSGEGPWVRARAGEGPEALPIHQHTRRDSPNNQPTPNPKNPSSDNKLAVNLPSQRQVCSKFPFHPKPQNPTKTTIPQNLQTPITAPHSSPLIPIPTTKHPKCEHAALPRPPSGNFRQDRGKNGNFLNPQNRSQIRSPKPDP